MGRPLKIQQYSTGSGQGQYAPGQPVYLDQGFPPFSALGAQNYPASMTSAQFLGVVGGANSIASATYPVVAVQANVDGVEGNSYIIRQKGATKYLVAATNTVSDGSFTVGNSYIITALGDTNWNVAGASPNAAVGDIFTAISVGGAGTGTVSNVDQCTLVAGATINSGEMNMTLDYGAGTGNVYASRLTNKYIWDGSDPPIRYAVNFFAPDNSGTIANVSITSNAGAFLSNAYTSLNVGDLVTVAGTNTGSGSISGYANPTNYFIITTNGSTTFTLSASLGGANVTTVVGNTRGLTFTADGGTTVVSKSGAEAQTWSNGNGNITLAQVSNYTS
jgi:hypothetical protein